MNKLDFYFLKLFEFVFDCYLIIVCLKYEDKILVYRLICGINLFVYIVICIFI